VWRTTVEAKFVSVGVPDFSIKWIKIEGLDGTPIHGFRLWNGK
jgi:hypothetical protein